SRGCRSCSPRRRDGPARPSLFSQFAAKNGVKSPAAAVNGGLRNAGRGDQGRRRLELQALPDRCPDEEPVVRPNTTVEGVIPVAPKVAVADEAADAVAQLRHVAGVELDSRLPAPPLEAPLVFFREFPGRILALLLNQVRGAGVIGNEKRRFVLPRGDDAPDANKATSSILRGEAARLR